MRPHQKSFLAAFAVTGNLTAAAAAAKLDRRRHYEWLDEPDYAEAFERAKQEACEHLETEARHRAVEGVRTPVIYQGQLCYEPELDSKGRPKRDDRGFIQLSNRQLFIREKSDTMLIFLMKAWMPDKYRDNSTIEHTGKGGAPLSIEVVFKKPE